MASDDLLHRVRVPEPLEALIAQLQQLRLAFGSDEADLIAAADADLRQAMAARDRGDRPEAVRLISSGMDRLAHLADRMDQAAGHAMRHVIAQFRAAVVRGHAADAQQAADVMREMSGAAIIDPDANEEDGGGVMRGGVMRGGVMRGGVMEERAHVDVAVVAEVDNDDSGLVGAPALVQADPEVYLWVCPNCGRRLQRRQCKARCMRCGFFQDCGDTGV